MLETNVTSVIAFTKTFVQGMIERNRGHIVNISSVAGTESYAGWVRRKCMRTHARDA
jgi:3-hydroxy acid dehydrogenase/malonic semialdehyde reductase